MQLGYIQELMTPEQLLAAAAAGVTEVPAPGEQEYGSQTIINLIQYAETYYPGSGLDAQLRSVYVSVADQIHLPLDQIEPPPSGPPQASEPPATTDTTGTAPVPSEPSEGPSMGMLALVGLGLYFLLRR